MLRTHPTHVDLLILGAGWTSTFLIPQLQSSSITYAATTTTGRDNTIPFTFDPNSGSAEPYKNLPSADTVLITFPLKGKGQSKTITGLYRSVHGQANRWIQLGVTSIFNGSERGNKGEWSDESSPYDREDVRAVAEDELIENVGGCVLDLCGLYGGERQPKRWIPRLAQSKEDVRKRKAVHFIHGEDVARAIIAVHTKWDKAGGKRWIIADLRVYDWYDLIMSFSALADDEEESLEDRKRKLQFAKWVGELMVEEGVKALPRDMSLLGRKLDSRGFWREMGIWPRHGRLA